jgi:CGNR zinc finger protein
VSRIGPREPGNVELATRRSLADLLWVANTRHGPGGHWFARVTVDDGDHDHLATPAEAVRYLADHHVDLPAGEPTARDLARLVAIREMARGLLDPTAGWTPAVHAILGRTRLRLDEERRLSAEAPGWQGFIGDLLMPMTELVRLRDRLTICGNPVCRLVFLDGSKSGTRRWCDDGGCGNRDRVRRHRRLHGSAGPTDRPA